MKIIAVLNQAGTVEACLNATARAAVAVPSAELEALHIVVDPERIIAADEEIDFQRMRERREGTASDKCTAIKVAFDAWSSNHASSTIQWQTIVAQEEEGLMQAARDADLLIMARNHDMDTGDAFHAILMRLDKPLLLVPHASSSAKSAEAGFGTIAIGIADTSAEHHALRAARPWLEASRHIVALHIGDQGATGMLAEDDLKGVTIDHLKVDKKPESNIGAQIAEEAVSAGADLLVCGAYRHSQLIEWLLGGTTRHLLDTATMPVLLAH